MKAPCKHGFWGLQSQAGSPDGIRRCLKEQSNKTEMQKIIIFSLTPVICLMCMYTDRGTVMNLVMYWIGWTSNILNFVVEAWHILKAALD